MPNTNLPGFPTSFSNTLEMQRAKQQLDLLNRELSQTPDQSSPASRKANEIRDLLKPDEITDL